MVVQNLVHLSNLAADAKVNSPVTDLDDQTTNNLWIDFGDDLELLALRVLGFGNSGFQSREEFGVEFLSNHVSVLKRSEEQVDRTLAVVTVTSISPLCALIN